jgi:uncharacterized protein
VHRVEERRAAMNTGRNAAVVRALYAAPDVETAIALVDRDCEWIESEVPEMPFHGTLRGTRALREDLYGRVPEFFQDFRLTPELVVEGEGDRVFVTGRVRATTLTGRSMDAPFAHLFELSDGVILRCSNFHDSAQWLDALRT